MLIQNTCVARDLEFTVEFEDWSVISLHCRILKSSRSRNNLIENKGGGERKGKRKEKEREGSDTAYVM